MIVLSPSLQKHWKDRDVFKILQGLKGKVYREKDNRKTFRTDIHGTPYFIKLYLGMGWKNLILSIVRFRFPVFSAQNEWTAIQRLETLNIKTMQLAGYGKRGWPPANQQSFVITYELTNTLSLENVCRDWPLSPPDRFFKRALITAVANITRKLHEDKLVHQDLYICHFLLDMPLHAEKDNHSDPCLHLIDLHRMQKKSLFRQRGRIKDVAALFFSSMDIGLTKRDIFRFIRMYKNTTLKSALRDTSFWRRVDRRAAALYAKANGRKPNSIL